MDDPLLSTLCNICHIDPPKYTCPRCSSQTCSLKCSKRHKIWSSCSGVRDPTVYKPLSQVATPSGIDHDYNFLHSIEHQISRSEKVLIEDLGLVTRNELQSAREGEAPEDFKQRTKPKEASGAACIARVLQKNNIRVTKAPKGMRRNKENTTHWLKNQKSINWQVEWMRDAGAKRDLYMAMGHKAIGDAYELMLEDERKLNMTDEERRAEKLKRSKRVKVHQRLVKRARLEEGKQALDLNTLPTLQDPDTTAWNLDLESKSKPETHLHLQDDDEEATLSPEHKHKHKPRPYNLYLHKPFTPASFPKILQPIDPEIPLTESLRDRDIIEFPTIYILDTSPHKLPKQFMLEKEYLAAIGQKVPSSDSKISGTSEGSSSSDSGSDEESSEEGEVSE